MNEKKDISDLLRSRLSNYQKPVADDIWAKIERDLPKKSPSAFWKKATSIVAGIVVVVGLIFVINTKDSSKPKDLTVENKSIAQTENSITVNKAFDVPQQPEGNNIIQEETQAVSQEKGKEVRANTNKVAATEKTPSEDNFPVSSTEVATAKSKHQEETLPQQIIELVEKDKVSYALSLEDLKNISSSSPNHKDETIINSSGNEESEFTGESNTQEDEAFGFQARSHSTSNSLSEDCDVTPALFFTPNSDGLNDEWIIENLDCLNTEYSIYIYDRAGILLMKYSNNYIPWDGIFAGREMPSTDYWYVIKLSNGKSKIGHFTLIRN